MTAALPAAVVQGAQREAQALLDAVAGVTAGVVDTIDGFEVACASVQAVDAPRIAALASSIAALGEVVSSEAGLGASRAVTVETEGGFAVAHRVPRGDVPLVLKVLAGRDAVLAQVKYRAASAARALAA